jgi:Methyltransferase FkbM domain
VPIDTVDAYCERLNIARIDVLKMDVQGWEMNVLAGAKNMLERGAIQFIYTEVTFRRDFADMQYFSELNDHLITHDFQLCGFYEIYRDGEHKEIVRYANVLYIHVPCANPA